MSEVDATSHNHKLHERLEVKNVVMTIFMLVFFSSLILKEQSLPPTQFEGIFLQPIMWRLIRPFMCIS